MPTPQIPSVLVSRPVRVVRPRDLTGLYVNPSSQLTRLEDQEAVWRLARGYYVLVPAKSVGSPGWRPTIEALALGVAGGLWSRSGCTDGSIRCTPWTHPSDTTMADRAFRRFAYSDRVGPFSIKDSESQSL